MQRGQCPKCRPKAGDAKIRIVQDWLYQNGGAIRLPHYVGVARRPSGQGDNKNCLLCCDTLWQPLGLLGPQQVMLAVKYTGFDACCKVHRL